jgi:hypothetical protein
MDSAAKIVGGIGESLHRVADPPLIRIVTANSHSGCILGTSG